MPKVTNAQSSKRVLEVLELLVDNRPRHQILQYASKAGWKLSNRQVDEYISKATKLLLETDRDTLDKTKAKLNAQLWKILRGADRNSDKVSAIKELSKIHGIGSTKVIVDDVRDLESVSDAELSSLLGEEGDSD